MIFFPDLTVLYHWGLSTHPEVDVLNWTEQGRLGVFRRSVAKVNITKTVTDNTGSATVQGASALHCTANSIKYHVSYNPLSCLLLSSSSDAERQKAVRGARCFFTLPGKSFMKAGALKIGPKKNEVTHLNIRTFPSAANHARWYRPHNLINLERVDTETAGRRENDYR